MVLSQRVNNMKLFKITALFFICTCMLIVTVQAQDNVLKDIKLGFGYDRGFGVVGTLGKFNGFIGNDGVAVDYIFLKKKLDEGSPLYCMLVVVVSEIGTVISVHGYLLV